MERLPNTAFGFTKPVFCGAMEEKKKKRESEEEDEEEEMKVDKFYALLRSFRDARERRRRELESEMEEMNKKKKMKAAREVSFESQDFTTEIHFRKPPLVFPNPIPCEEKKKKKELQQPQDLTLDLKLAL